MANYLLFAGGLALLVVGGDLLVRGASTTAARRGMPSMHTCLPREKAAGSLIDISALVRLRN
jgi:Ca2+/Na+ antiporter